MSLPAPRQPAAEGKAQTDDMAAFAAETQSSAPLSFRLFETLEAAEPAWRTLESRGVLTSYQRFDWIRTFVATHGLDAGRIAIAMLFDGKAPVALLPLVVTTRFGIRTARLIGWQIGNSDWLALDPGVAPALDRPALEGFLAAISRATGADILALHSQPERWGSIDNPLLVFPHQPAPDHFYRGTADTGRLTAKRLRNIERGRRRIEEMLGPLRLTRATTPEEIDAVHAEFLRQRSLRFDAMGVENRFADDWFRRFFSEAAQAGLLEARPVLAFHALYAGDTILATSCGSYCGTHYSQYINSTTDGPAAKYSLMAMLMLELVAELKADGVSTLDMGLGDFDYKLDWTDKAVVWDAVLPLSGKGRVAAQLLLGARRAKRAIKQHDRLWTVVRKLRAALHRGR